MSENYLYGELNKLYVKVAAMNGYIKEFQNMVDDTLQAIDHLQTKIDDERVKDAKEIWNLTHPEQQYAPEHLGNNGDECMGCSDDNCERAKIDPTDYIEAK